MRADNSWLRTGNSSTARECKQREACSSGAGGSAALFEAGTAYFSYRDVMPPASKGVYGLAIYTR
jgi:hypothetical protein